MVRSSREKTFTAPTADQLRVHLQRCAPRSPSQLAAWLPLLVILGALALSVVVENPLLIMLTWLGALVMIVALGIRARRARLLEQGVVRAQELVLLRHWDSGLRLAWRLLPSLVTVPAMHGRLVILIANCLDRLKAYDAAIVGYDYLVERLPNDDPGSVQLRVQRSIIHLINDQLSDADDSLRRIRGHLEPYDGSVIHAAFRYAQLLQQTRTNHWEEAVISAPHMTEGLRPLGVEAGYGHALIALSFHKLAEQNTAMRGHAQQWWSSATLLLPIEALIDQFGELRCLVGYTSTPSPRVLAGE